MTDDYETIKNLFYQKAKDDDYPEIDYSGGVWSGKEDNEEEDMGISVSLASVSKMFSNNCIIELPYRGEILDYYQDRVRREELVSFLEAYWEAEKTEIFYNCKQATVS